jgi:hypothetical protein
MTANRSEKPKTRQERELWKCRGCGKRGKPKAGFPLFPQPLGNLAKDRRDSHISTAPAEAGDGKVENQKLVSHFPTATSPFSPGTKTRAAGGLRPPPGGERFAPPKSQRVVVVDREK